MTPAPMHIPHDLMAEIDRTIGPGTLQNRVDYFKQVLELHKTTVGVPVPTEAPIVEQIVRHHGGAFVVEPAPDEPAPVEPAP